MSRSRASYGVVTLPTLDLRTRPAHRAELGSQLLLGEIVRLLATDPTGQWQRVRNLADGYEGWVRDWGLVRCSRVRAERWREAADAWSWRHWRRLESLPAKAPRSLRCSSGPD